MEEELLKVNYEKNFYNLELQCGVMDVSVAGDLAMRALTERIAGSQWVVMAGQPISQYIQSQPFVWTIGQLPKISRLTKLLFGDRGLVATLENR